MQHYTMVPQAVISSALSGEGQESTVGAGSEQDETVEA